jgi:hypothetical protein
MQLGNAGPITSRRCALLVSSFVSPPNFSGGATHVGQDLLTLVKMIEVRTTRTINIAIPEIIPTLVHIVFVDPIFFKKTGHEMYKISGLKNQSTHPHSLTAKIYF